MIVKEEVTKFISKLMEEDKTLFPYIHNSNYVKGQSSVYYSGPYWDEKEVSAAINSLIKGKWLSAGEEVNKFEILFSKKFGFNHSVMVNSGSSANLVMIASLKKYFNWNDDDEIIVCACGFPTTINSVIQNNLKVTFVDIDYSDLNWDVNEVVSKITSKTKAVFSSPVLGNPGNYDKILDVCDKYNLKLIADNCDSLGSKWNGKYLTDYAVASSCSFYPAHHISTIEGGMVSSNIKEVVDLARSFAWWGRDCYCVGQQNLLSCGTCGKRFDNWLSDYSGIVDHKYVFSNMGYNLKPADLQGSIGLVQLEKFEEVHQKRRSNKEKIQKIFERVPFCRVIDEFPQAEVSWFGVPIVCDLDKNKLVQYLEANKIQTRNYFAGNILMHPAYKHLEPASNYPNSSKVLDNVFFVGCSPVITDPMIEYIEEVVNNFIKSN